HTLASMDEPKTAAAALDEAIQSAVAAGDDPLAARAWDQLVWVHGSLERRADDGERAAGFARALLTRLGGHASLEAALESHLAMASSNAGKYADARAHYQKALDLLRSIHGEE